MYLDFTKNDSYIYFGGFEQNMLSTNLTWIPVMDGEKHWTLESSNLIIMNNSIGIISKCTFDSGTNQILLPNSIFNSIAQYLDC